MVSTVAADAARLDVTSKPVAMTILFILLLLMTNTFQRSVDGLAEPVDDHVDILRCRNIGRRQQHVVAAAAIRRSARGVTGKATLEGSRLDPRVELERGIERFTAGAIGHQFDG